MSGLTEKLDFSFARRLPLVLQSEAAECGLACLAMVAAYHGHETDIGSLRARHGMSLRGATLQQVMAAASDLRMVGRPLRLELDEVQNLRLPCILHWDLDHFVVVKKVSGRRVTLHDPAVGVRRVDMRELGRHFTGVALELRPAEGFERRKRARRLRIADLWSRSQGFKRVLGQVLLLSLAIQFFVLAAPFYMQLVVDEVLVAADAELLSVLASGFALLMLVHVGTWLLRSTVLIYLGSQLSAQMAENIFRHLVQLPLSWFQSRHMGDVVSRFGSFEKITEFLASSVVESVVDGIMVVGTLAVMTWYSPLLTAVVCLITALYVAAKLALFPRMRRLAEESITAAARNESNFMETVRSIQSIKLYGKELQRQVLWGNGYVGTLNARVREGRFRLGYESLNRLLFGGERVLIVYLAALEVMGGTLSVGMLFAFMAYREQFVGKGASLVDRLVQFKLLGLHLERLADIVHTPVEEARAFELPRRLRGHLRLENVVFGYSADTPPLFDGLSLEIRPGESVAVAGASGCGKSSLMKLMLGFLVPTSGKVRVDGIELAKMGSRAFRARVGAVLQDDPLLSGSIADNIAFFDLDAAPPRIEEAARLAGIHEEILAMPMGYGSLIGDMGSALSGGQKQRILLARALYRRPDILFLDEATAHLDPETEKRVNDNIRRMRLTRVVIAHRQETLLSADRVLLLEGGRVRELAPGCRREVEPAGDAEDGVTSPGGRAPL